MQDSKPEVIVKHCVHNWRQHERALLLTAKGWKRITPQLVVGLLQNATHEAAGPAKRLLWSMQRQPWFLHEHGDSIGVDHTALNIEVAGRHWRLHCKEGAHLRRIEEAA